MTNNERKIWHYGLMAERWAEFLLETPELPFLQEVIVKYGEPVLDLACGAGRLLLPLARSGVDIDGSDFSQDMLDQCRRVVDKEGLDIDLHRASMDEIELPRSYRTIYIIGSFGLAGGRAADLAAMQRCYEHLQPGGALILNIQAEYNSPEAWELWLPENRNSLPQPWPKDGRPRIAADGSEHRGYFRTTELDPLQQTYTREVRLEKWVEAERVASETYALTGNMYFKNEVELMLRVAGFNEVVVQGDYRDNPATEKHEEIVFTAVK